MKTAHSGSVYVRNNIRTVQRGSSQARKRREKFLKGVL
jgi:hypothetical protein